MREREKEESAHVRWIKKQYFLITFSYNELPSLSVKFFFIFECFDVVGVFVCW